MQYALREIRTAGHLLGLLEIKIIIKQFHSIGTTMHNTLKALIFLPALFISKMSFAQCDPTLPRAHLITCLSNQIQNETGVRPHQSQFNQPNLIFQPPAPLYQAAPPPTNFQQQQPIYQLPPVQWVPSNQGSAYR
jgi:hypothetical protein